MTKSEKFPSMQGVKQDYLGCEATKPVFGVSDKGILKLVSSAAETS